MIQKVASIGLVLLLTSSFSYASVIEPDSSQNFDRASMPLHTIDGHLEGIIRKLEENSEKINLTSISQIASQPILEELVRITPTHFVDPRLLKRTEDEVLGEDDKDQNDAFQAVVKAFLQDALDSALEKIGKESLQELALKTYHSVMLTNTEQDLYQLFKIMMAFRKVTKSLESQLTGIDSTVIQEMESNLKRFKISNDYESKRFRNLGNFLNIIYAFYPIPFDDGYTIERSVAMISKVVEARKMADSLEKMMMGVPTQDLFFITRYFQEITNDLSNYILKYGSWILQNEEFEQNSSDPKILLEKTLETWEKYFKQKHFEKSKSVSHATSTETAPIKIGLMTEQNSSASSHPASSSTEAPQASSRPQSEALRTLIVATGSDTVPTLPFVMSSTSASKYASISPERKPITATPQATSSTGNFSNELTKAIKAPVLKKTTEAHPSSKTKVTTHSSTLLSSLNTSDPQARLKKTSEPHSSAKPVVTPRTGDDRAGHVAELLKKALLKTFSHMTPESDSEDDTTWEDE